jgi:hypothetical protein
MTPPRARARAAFRRCTAPLAVVLVLSGAACGGNDRTPDAAPEPGTTMPIIDRPTYANGTLTLADLTVHLFPDYRNSDFRPVPVGWPPATGIVLRHRGDSFASPTVSAAVFQPRHGVDDDPMSPIRMAEASFGDGVASGSVLAEGTATGPERTCHYRIRSGPVVKDPTVGPAHVGTVVAVAPGRPALAILVDDLDKDAITRLTGEIVAALCQTTAPKPGEHG